VVSERLFLSIVNKPSYNEPVVETTYFAYQRKNHFNEILNQVQGRETTKLPEALFDDIREELKKDRLPVEKLTSVKLKQYMKKLGYSKYHEHNHYIINHLKNLPPSVLPREIEQKVKVMFAQIQEPFKMFCPPDRVNFLSYTYVLYKMFELLELDEYLPWFSLLKSKTKLKKQDEIWEKICEYLRWEFIPTDVQ
jgi:hypothetical protein